MAKKKLIAGVDYEAFDCLDYFGRNSFAKSDARDILRQVLSDSQTDALFDGKAKLDVEDLSGGNVQRSFYGKARIANYENSGKLLTFLISYNTAVAMLDSKGRFVRLWNGHSATTAKHLSRFMDRYKLPHVCKADWLSMPIGKPSGIEIQ